MRAGTFGGEPWRDAGAARAVRRGRPGDRAAAWPGPMIRGRRSRTPWRVGYEIFNREWLPDDPRSHGGDGLGPVYNDSSCVACHNSGGSGGAGPVSKNIDILNASRGIVAKRARQMVPERTVDKAQSPVKPAEARSSPRETLTDFHAGFRTSRTVVLHKFGTDPNYDAWRSRALSPPRAADRRLPGPSRARRDPTRSMRERRTSRSTRTPVTARTARPPRIRPPLVPRRGSRRSGRRCSAGNPALRQPSVAVGGFVVSRSQRNPTPLFGLGLIDAIPDAAIEKIAMEEARNSPETEGRVSRLKDGRIGRLGWKGRRPTPRTSCSMPAPSRSVWRSRAITGDDPAGPEVSLARPRPDRRRVRRAGRLRPEPAQPGRAPIHGAAEAKHLEGGKAMFASVGCANCHAPKLGDVEGIYSDLLLHDMGSEMGDDGSYDPGDPSDPDDPPLPGSGRWGRGRQAAGSATASVALTRRVPASRNGGRRRSGASATRARTSTTAGADPGAGRRVARRPGRGLGSEVLPALAQGAIAGRGVPQVAGRPAVGPARPPRRLNRASVAGLVSGQSVGSAHPTNPQSWHGCVAVSGPKGEFVACARTARPRCWRCALADAPASRRARDSPGATACRDRRERARRRPGLLARRQDDRDGRRQRDRRPPGCRESGASVVSSAIPTVRSGAGDQPRQQDARHRRRWQGCPPLGPRHGPSGAVLKGHDGPITCLAFSRDGKSLASGSRDSSAMVWDVATGTARATLARHTSAVTSVAFAPDGKTLATGSLDWTAKVWDLPSGKLRLNLDGHRDVVVAVAFSPDGKTLATSSRDGLARLWDVAEGSERTAMQTHAGPAGPLAFLPDGRALITGGADGSLRRWDPADGHVQALRLRADAGPIVALAASADGKTLATIGGDGELKTWDIAAQLAPMPFAGVEAKVRSLALSPDGKVLASSSADGLVQLWDTARGRQRGEPIRFEAREIRLAFSADGKILGTLPIGATSERLQLRDPSSGRELELLAAEPDSTTRCFAFAPDGRALVTAGGPITIWGLGGDLPSAPSRDARAWSARSPIPPTVRRSPRRAATVPSRSGTRPAVPPSPGWRGTPRRSSASPSPPTARRWPAAAVTGLSGSGTRSSGPNAPRSAARSCP